jgi:hypothetical protein
MTSILQYLKYLKENERDSEVGGPKVKSTLAHATLTFSQICCD